MTVCQLPLSTYCLQISWQHSPDPYLDSAEHNRFRHQWRGQQLQAHLVPCTQLLERAKIRHNCTKDSQLQITCYHGVHNFMLLNASSCFRKTTYSLFPGSLALRAPLIVMHCERQYINVQIQYSGGTKFIHAISWIATSKKLATVWISEYHCLALVSCIVFYLYI